MASWFEQFDQAVAEKIPQLTVVRDEPMAAHTTFRIGGAARRMVRPSSVQELSALVTLAEAEDFPYLMLGNGSNLLVADAGVDALVIHTGELDGMQRLANDEVYAEAGVSLARLAVFARKEGLAGLEFAHGIPGSLGGAVCMNAGAYGKEMRDVIVSVTAWLPGRGVCELSSEALQLCYRHSYFSDHDGVVLGARLRLTPGEERDIAARMEDLIRRRREKQPLEFPSAGSTFRRPEGHFAGALIEQCGLKGTRVGGVQVSEKHAGFLINVGGATCDDVLSLMTLIQRTVREKTGVLLEPEVRVIGREDE